jgi:hypothetical protein
MPVARYFLWVGGVLLALLFFADACLPQLPSLRVAAASRAVIRIHSEPKWPERIVFDTSAQLPQVIAVASSEQVVPLADPLQSVSPPPSTAAMPDRAREALAQLQPPVVNQRATKPRQESSHLRSHATRHVARVTPRLARPRQYAWFSDRMWW